MASEQPPRPHTADPESHYGFLGTRRSFPLVGRKRTKASSTLSRPSTSHHPLPPSTGLRVRLFLRFSNPLNSEHHAEFQSSPSFGPSDQVCQALLRRLQHCSAELITRRDCTAMDPPQATPQSAAARPMRFQMTFCIDRHGLRWAEETFTSYQHEPLSPDQAEQVLAEARLAVSLFLSRHDPGFRSAEADSVAVPQTSRPCFGLPQSVCCIPQDQDGRQPGYIVELFLRSRAPNTQKNSSIKLESVQSSPLTLLLGEDVLSRASKALDLVFEDRKLRFGELHRSCESLEGSGGCSHVIDGAFDALLKIRNNIGPDYNHLSHRLQSHRIIFGQEDSHDFDSFVAHVKEQLEIVRDQADRALNAVDDLAFNIRRMEIHGRSVLNPLCISLDASFTHDRRTTKALADRVQAGIRHGLKGTGASLVLTAHKRGHLILDTVLQDAQEPASDEPLPRIDDILTALRDQIRADIAMICTDTCSLDSTDLLQNLKIYDARTAAHDERPSTSGPMLPDEPPVTPTRQSLSKRKGQFNLRQVSLSSSKGIPPTEADLTPTRNYMAVAPSDDAYLSDDSSTPSLVDTDSISPHDSILITPESTRVAPRERPTFGIRLMDDELIGAPISTEELGPPHDEDGTVYERPPFHNPFAPSKAPSSLSVSVSPDDIDTATVVPDSVPVSAQVAIPAQLQDESPPTTEIPPEASDSCKDDLSIDNSNKTTNENGETSQVDFPADTLTGDAADIPKIEVVSKDLPETLAPEPAPLLEATSLPTVDLSSETNNASFAPLEETQQDVAVSSREREETASELATTGYFSLNRPSILPHMNAVDEPPKSSALILRTRPESFHINTLFGKDPAHNVLDDKQQRRWSNPRPSFRHRRQFSSPTAGYLGLHGEYLVEMGLMNAVIPSHLRSTKS